MQVDWAGDTAAAVDTDTGEIVLACMFVVRFPLVHHHAGLLCSYNLSKKASVFTILQTFLQAQERHLVEGVPSRCDPF